MQTIEYANQSAADLYWLAFLLTGQRAASVDATLEGLEVADGANAFFSSWILAWSRRVVIAKALAAVRGELAASARRTAMKRADRAGALPRNWQLAPGTTRVQLERALAPMDAFPRCALILSIFEGMPVEDVAVLLDAGPDLVRKAQVIGLRELTRNLARLQGWKSAAARSYVIPSEMQHA